MTATKKIAGWIVFAMAFGALCLSLQNAKADTCDESCLRSVFASGGSQTIDSSGGVTLTGGPLVVPTNVILNIDAGTNTVVLAGSSDRILYIESDASVYLSGFTFLNGQSSNGGAIYIEPGATVILTNCTFISNKAIGSDGFDGDDGSDHKWDNGGSGKKGEPGENAVGGAIFNLGNLTILRCQFLTNSATAGNGGNGGNGGSSDNFRGGDGGEAGDGGFAIGGAIYNESQSFYVVDSTFAGNSATGGDGGDGGEGGTGNWSDGLPGDGGKGGSASGGGIYSVSTDTNYVWNSTFSDNTANGGAGKDGGGSVTGIGKNGGRGGAASGAGFFNLGILYLANNTFYHNLATGGDSGNGGTGGRGGNGGNGGPATGGGLCNTGAVYVLNCTFAFNGAFGGTNGAGGTGLNYGKNGKKGQAHGGNIASIVSKKRGQFALKNSIIGTNLSGGNGFGAIIDFGNNISTDKSIKLKTANGSYPKTDPGLAAFADYGGPTKTIALLTNSFAIDKGDDTAAPLTDQRGVLRSSYPPSDIGAYEAGPLFIQTQPQSQTASVGASVTFSVSVLGDPPLHYDWYFIDTVNSSNVLVSSGSSSSYTISSVSTNNAGDYFVVVSNNKGSETSDVATLTVVLTPTITVQPVSQTIVVTNPVTFSVSAAGQAPLSYQWYFTNSASSVPSPITDATNSTYTIASVSTNNAGGYFAVVTNDYGSATSSVAVLTVQVVPVITKQPTNQTVSSGATATFSVTATGAMPLYYQWLFNATNALDGATNTSLSLSSVQSTNAGTYSVLVTNAFGSVLSSNATLKVSSSSGPPVP